MLGPSVKPSVALNCPTHALNYRSSNENTDDNADADGNGANNDTDADQ